MAFFGKYEVVQELTRTPFGVVYSAKEEGAPAGTLFLVKTFHPVGSLDDDISSDPDVRAFIERAEVQRKAAEAGGRNWAPIFETGVVREGAFYVSRFYPSSVQRLVKGKVRLDARTLHGLILEVFKGLRELRTACSQPHGNLRPATVLLAKRDRVGYAEVVLAEPLLPDAARRSGEAGDMQGLGDMIHQLVTHRPFNTAGGWPIKDSAEWSGLGKMGGRWLGFCNQLLDPAATLESLTLDAMAAELAKLKVKKSKLPLVVGAALVCVLAVGGYAGLAYMNWRKEWKTYAVSYAEWFRPMDVDFDSAELQELREKMQGDAYLMEHVVKPLKEAREKQTVFDPKRLSGELALSYEEQAQSLPMSFEVARRTREARRVMSEVETALAPGKWPALEATAGRKAEYEKRGWSGAAKYLDGIVAGARPRGGGKLDEGIRRLLEVQPQLTKVEEAWGTVQREAGALKKTGDKVLGKFEEYAQEKSRGTAQAGAAEEGEVAIAALLERLTEVGELGGQLEAFATGREFAGIDRKLFERKSSVHASDKIDERVLKGWLVEVRRYPLDTTPDPRQGWRPADELAKVEASLGALRKVHEENKEMPGERVALLSDRVSKARARIGETGKMEWDAENRPAVERAMVELNGELRQLQDGLASASSEAQRWIRTRDAERNKTFADVLAGLKEQGLNVGSPALAAAWEMQRDALLAGAAAGGPGSLEETKRELGRYQSALEGLAGEFPTEMALPSRQRWNDGVAAVFRQQAAARREAALKSAVGQMKFAAGTPARDAAFEAAWKKRRDEHAAWAEAAKGFVEDWNVVGDLLDLGYGLGEEKAGQAVTIAALVKKGEALLNDPAIKGAMGSALGRVAELEGIEKSSDRVALAATAEKNDNLAVARAAWRRLHEQRPGWPGNAAELRREATLRDRLATLIGLVKETGRKEALAGELKDEGPRSIRNVLASAADEKSIEESLAAVLAMKDRFGVGQRNSLPADEIARLGLDARFEFNYFLYRNRSAIRDLKELPDADAKDRIAKLRADLPKKLPDAPEVAVFVKGLDDLRKDTGAAVASPANAGPMASPIKDLVAWQQKESGGEVTFTWKGQELKFIRIDGAMTAEGKRLGSYYLCTTEVSVGLMRDVLSAAKMTLAEAGLPPSPPSGGPCGWRMGQAGKSIEASLNWLPTVPHLEEKEKDGKVRNYYAPGLVADGAPRRLKLAEANPSLVHPMQFLKVEAAMRFANLLGCRLPTTAEWEAAVAKQRKHSVNLRSGVWQAQQAHIAGLRNTIGSPQIVFPDAGAFVPLNAPPLGKEFKALVWQAGDLSGLKMQKVQLEVQPNDTYLFFGPVGGADPISNLIGNVAEFVWDEPDQFDKLADKSVAGLTGMVEKNEAAVGVVGGSSISPPEIGIARQAMDPLKPHYADVGFRLAFPASNRSLVSRLKELVEAQKYVVAGGGAEAGI